MKMPKQTAPIARNLHTTAHTIKQDGVEAAAFSWRDLIYTTMPTFPTSPVKNYF